MKKRMLCSVVVALTIMVLTSSTDATLYAVTPTPSLAKIADTIIVGEVTHTESEWSDGKIVTRVDLIVEQTVKGTGLERMTLVVPGGRVGDLRMKVIDGPTFRTGERALILAKASASDHRIVGLARGKLLVTRLRSGDDVVSWIPTGKTRHEVASLETVVLALKTKPKQ